MARRTISVCDLHPENEEVRADETVDFTGPDGGKYQIDLCPEHRDLIHTWQEQYAAFVAKATVVDPPPRQVRRNRTDVVENAAIRAWAQSQGVNLGQRGRIPEELRQRYRDEVGNSARDRWTASNGQPRARVPVPT